jgi:hypothetical protein
LKEHPPSKKIRRPPYGGSVFRPEIGRRTDKDILRDLEKAFGASSAEGQAASNRASVDPAEGLSPQGHPLIKAGRRRAFLQHG